MIDLSSKELSKGVKFLRVFSLLNTNEILWKVSNVDNQHV